MVSNHDIVHRSRTAGNLNCTGTTTNESHIAASISHGGIPNLVLTKFRIFITPDLYTTLQAGFQRQGRAIPGQHGIIQTILADTFHHCNTFSRNVLTTVCQTAGALGIQRNEIGSNFCSILQSSNIQTNGQCITTRGKRICFQQVFKGTKGQFFTQNQLTCGGQVATKGQFVGGKLHLITQSQRHISCSLGGRGLHQTFPVLRKSCIGTKHQIGADVVSTGTGQLSHALTGQGFSLQRLAGSDIKRTGITSHRDAHGTQILAENEFTTIQHKTGSSSTCLVGKVQGAVIIHNTRGYPVFRTYAHIHHQRIAILQRCTVATHGHAGCFHRCGVAKRYDAGVDV